MDKEQLRMQMLASVITEGEYKAKLEENNTTEDKDSLNENFVGMSATPRLVHLFFALNSAAAARRLGTSNLE